MSINHFIVQGYNDINTKKKVCKVTIGNKLNKRGPEKLL